MERGPLPPHERSWRHPSELAADTRQAIRTEQPAATLRTAALVGGVASIVLVGVAVLALTPDATSSPTATGSTPVDVSGTVGLGSARGDPDRGGSPAPSGASDERSTATPVSSLSPGPVAVAGGASVEAVQRITTPRPRALATRLDRTGLAVIPSRSVLPVAHRSPIEVRLHDGSSFSATVVDPGDGTGLAIVQLHLADEAADDGGDDLADGDGDGSDGDGTTWFAVAAEMPDGDDTVTVLTDDPIRTEIDDIVELEPSAIADGTAVVDGNGHLVGIVTTDPLPGRAGSDGPGDQHQDRDPDQDPDPDTGQDPGQDAGQLGGAGADPVGARWECRLIPVEADVLVSVDADAGSSGPG